MTIVIGAAKEVARGKMPPPVHPYPPVTVPLPTKQCQTAVLFIRSDAQVDHILSHQQCGSRSSAGGGKGRGWDQGSLKGEHDSIAVWPTQRFYCLVVVRRASSGHHNDTHPLGFLAAVHRPQKLTLASRAHQPTNEGGWVGGRLPRNPCPLVGPKGREYTTRIPAGEYSSQ
ncbi:hypothetical protein Pmani_004425 [Petrolisthes manimaculis]|uniref:Uncharacterized protein n=1 Tax=Petrolisthes manimaculis TaxID=1843537 RepID=A0AAE1QGP4_9EUCA|nr:hypothetical protein Pmani_004425 [Petrolisthes manimaculis]